MHLSFQKIFYVIATVIGLFAILILAKGVLIPFAFAFLIAFILYPISERFEYWGTNKIMSGILAFLGLFIVIGSVILLFSNQIIQLVETLPDFQDKILKAFTGATLFINKNIGFLPQQEEGELFAQMKDWLRTSAGPLISQTASGTANLLFGLLSSLIFAFLILIYRNGLVQAFVRFYPEAHRERAIKMLKAVQQVGQQYLSGMMVIILILGLANSLGLWIIGLDNPFLFGFLAAVLALIPYAGTFLGAAIPILYALIAYDSLWMPITIAIFFWLVQLIESNFLTPKIVGGNLKINALTSILSIIIGASVWGIAGMIIFLPLAAILKVVSEAYEELKPIALLIGEQTEKTTDGNGNFIDKGLAKLKTWFSSSRNTA